MKNALLAVAFAIAVLAVLIGLVVWDTQHGLGASTQGSTGMTAKQFNIYGVNLAAPGANATSSSIQNTTGQDIYVNAIKVGCEGIGTSKTAYTGTGLVSLQLSVGTTSAAAPSVNNSLLVGGGALVISTSSTQTVFASSTSATPGTGLINNIWLAGSYMTFTTNATNTAVCTFGVDGFTA